MGVESEVHRLGLVARRLEDEKAEMAREIDRLRNDRERLTQELESLAAARRSSWLSLDWLRRLRAQP
jgi:predicted RNase H-like nuclease (RuvC/YqgF family)